MPRSPASKPRTSILDKSIGGYVLRPAVKAAIKTLATQVALIDSQRRALTGQAGPAPLGRSLVAAGLAPLAAITPAPAIRPRAHPAAAGRRAQQAPRRPSPMGESAREFFAEKAATLGDNVDYHMDEARAGLGSLEKWAEGRPKVVGENLAPFRAGLETYLDMLSKVDMTDAGMPTPEQMRLRDEARRNRPRPDYNLPHFREVRREREAMNPVARQVDAGARAFADTAAWGAPNYAEALLQSWGNDYSYAENLEAQRYIDLLDSQDAAAAQIAGRVAGAFVPFGNKYVAAAKTLPAAIGRAGAAETVKGFGTGVISTPGDLEERFEGGFETALSDAMYAPLGPLAERGVMEVAPLAARQYPFLKGGLSGLATSVPKEVADALADAETRRAERRRNGLPFRPGP